MISTQGTEGRVRRRRARPQIDAVSVLTAFLVTLVCLPARLIFAPLGAVGTPAEVIGIFAAVWWASTRVVPHLGGFVGRQPLRVALGFFGIALLAGYTSGMLRPLLGVESRAADRMMLATIAWVGVALLGADGVSDRSRLEVLLRRLVLLGALLATVGVVQFFTGFEIAKYIRVPGLRENFPIEGLQIRSGLRRVAGTALHPIEFGVVMAIILPLALRQAMTASRLRERVPVILISLALPMALSRSATLGAATGLIVMLAGWHVRRRVNGLVGGLIFLGLLNAAVPRLLGTIQGLFLNIQRDPSTTTRTDDYSQVWGMIRDQPVFGRGSGTYVPVVYRILDNQFLLTLIESGVVGVLGLMGLFFTAMSCARGARRRSSDEPTRELGQALAASLAATMVCFATFDAFSYPMCTGIFFVVIGCSGALWRLEMQAHTPDRLVL